MPTLVDCVQIALEETGRYENAPAATPYRVSTDVLYLPLQTVGFQANPTMIDRSDELRGIEGGVPGLVDGYEPGGGLAMRAYINALTWLLTACGFKGVRTAGGAGVTDPTSTAVVGAHALNSATITVTSTDGFLPSGSIVIGAETITYTGKTATTFTGVGAHAALAGGETVRQNIPAGVSRWEFTKRGGVSAKTLQVIKAYAVQGVFVRGQGVGVASLGLNAGGDLTADLVGLVYQRIADPNLVPVFDASSIPHARRGDLLLSPWMAGYGEISDFSLTVANELVRHRTLSRDPSSYFPDVLEHGDAKVRATLSVPTRILTTGAVDAILAASTFAGKARWRLPVNVGATTYPYAMWWDFPKLQVSAGTTDEIANRRRFGASIDLFAAWDETAGYDMKITLANAVSSIDAPGVGL